MNRGGAGGERGGRGLRVARGHIGQRLRRVRGIERVGEQHGVVHCSTQRHALRGEQVESRLPVVSLLGDGGVFQQCAQLRGQRESRAVAGSAQTPTVKLACFSAASATSSSERFCWRFVFRFFGAGGFASSAKAKPCARAAA